MKNFGVILVLTFLRLVISTVQVEAKTAVTITVEAGPAFTEGNLTTVDLIVPECPPEAPPLNVGDKVFFEALEPTLEGEGTINNIYHTEDSTINKAIILIPVYH